MSHGKGITIAEECHIVNALAPVDVAGVAKTSDYFHLKNAAHATIIITCGAVTNAATITLYEADDAEPTNEAAVSTFDYYQETTAAGDTLGARTAGANFSTGTNNGTIHVIEIDASELSDGYPYLAVKISNAGANLISVVAILSGVRFQEAATATAIT